MTSKVYLQTGKDQLVDATEIVPLSVLLNELKETYDDEPIEVIVGDPAIVHQQTVDAIEAIKMLPSLAKMLNEFNNPVKPEDEEEITLETMKELHDSITTRKRKWRELSDGNPVYEWLFPISEYTMVVNCTTDVYSYYCDTKLPKEKTNFQSLCKSGNLEVAQWLYSLGCVNIHACNNIAFKYACSCGHLEMTQWLYSLGVSIHTYVNRAFREACVDGHLEMSQWLYSLGNVDIHLDNNWVFHLACVNGHLEISQWLYSLGCIYKDTEYSFWRTCYKGHLDVAQWLYSFGGVNIHERDEFKWKYRCGRLEVVTWLNSLETKE
jgi:hypothetical protein